MASSNEQHEDEANDEELQHRATKRQKTFTDELVCPFTLELPFDPVTAEDGRVYERSAIEQHIKGKSSEELKSPMTGSKMGSRLFPAVQHKNLIQSMIESGDITGSLADNWNKRAKQKTAMDALIKKAESGGGKAMERLGHYYLRGREGFKRDYKLAYAWNKKAHESGMVAGTARMAYVLLRGQGVKREKEGIMFLSIAAAQGSDTASYRLGLALADGKHGLPVNKPEAIKWLLKSLSDECKLKHMNEVGRKHAREKLEELTNEST